MLFSFIFIYSHTLGGWVIFLVHGKNKFLDFLRVFYQHIWLVETTWGNRVITITDMAQAEEVLDRLLSVGLASNLTVLSLLQQLRGKNLAKNLKTVVRRARRVPPPPMGLPSKFSFCKVTNGQLPALGGVLEKELGEYLCSRISSLTLGFRCCQMWASQGKMHQWEAAKLFLQMAAAEWLPMDYNGELRGETVKVMEFLSFMGVSQLIEQKQSVKQCKN